MIEVATFDAAHESALSAAPQPWLELDDRGRSLVRIKPLLEFRLRPTLSTSLHPSLTHYNRSLYNFRPAAAFLYLKKEKKSGRVGGARLK